MAWLLYGAYGYTGELIARRALDKGDEPPILAGRREAPLRALAEELGLEWRAFPLGGTPDRRADHLEGVDAVLHVAGPFSQTSAPMVRACLARGAHYLDVTGEVDVFEAVFARDEEARQAGGTLLPGVGFDVVPSDCLAAALASRLPEACRLELAIYSESQETSQGTAKSMLEGVSQGGRVRRRGRLERVSFGHATRVVAFPPGRRRCVAIPWGDLSTAYRSTGIEEITTYMAQPALAIAGTRLANLAAPILSLGPVQRRLNRWIERNVSGPSESTRERAQTHVWGRVEDRWGVALEGSVTTPEAYRFTADSALACLERVRAGDAPAGAQTPSLAFGAEFVTGLEDVCWRLPAARLASE